MNFFQGQGWEQKLVFVKTGELLLQSIGPGFHLVLTHLKEGQHSQLCKLRQSNQHMATNSKGKWGM